MLLGTSETGRRGYRRALELEKKAGLRNDHSLKSEFFPRTVVFVC